MTEENKQELKPCRVCKKQMDMLRGSRAGMTTIIKLETEVERLKAQLSKHQMSEFHPDWSLLKASIDNNGECDIEIKRLTKGCQELESEVERLKGDHAELWAERNGYQISAENALAERDNYKRLLTVALNTFKLQIDGNRTNRKSLAIIAYEGINDQLEEK
jgi:capsule polysaccharide export protein KpsE/RkpR